MLVRYTGKNTYDGGLNTNDVLVVYGIDFHITENKIEIHCFVTKPRIKYSHLVPERMAMDDFQIIDKSIPEEWKTKSLHSIASNPMIAFAFPEMLEDERFVRLHDMEFNPNDAEALLKYIKNYEEKYKESITPTYRFKHN